MIAEELNLREMRRLRKLTQARLSKKLKIGQEGVSRIEKRTDLYLSTLRSYVEGVGGKLSLVVEFPDRAPVFWLDWAKNRRRKRPEEKSAKGPKRRQIEDRKPAARPERRPWRCNILFIN